MATFGGIVAVAGMNVGVAGEPSSGGGWPIGCERTILHSQDFLNEEGRSEGIVKIPRARGPGSPESQLTIRGKERATPCAQSRKYAGRKQEEILDAIATHAIGVARRGEPVVSLSGLHEA